MELRHGIAGHTAADGRGRARPDPSGLPCPRKEWRVTSRERVRTALAHREPDRVPVDFGSDDRHRNACPLRGAIPHPLRSRASARESARAVQHAGACRGRSGRRDGTGHRRRPSAKHLYGYPNENWKEFQTPWGQIVLISGHFQYTTDANGDLLTYPQGDGTAPPSGRMPPSSYFFDTIIRQGEIDEDHLNPEDNLQEFGPLSEADVAHFKSEIAAAAGTGRAVIAAIGGTGFGDIACGARAGSQAPKGIRDITEWYVSLATRQDYVQTVFSRQCEIAHGPPPAASRGRGRCHRYHLPVRNRFRNPDFSVLLAGDVRPIVGSALSKDERVDPREYHVEDDEAHLRSRGIPLAPLDRRGFRHLQPGPVFGGGDGTARAQAEVRRAAGLLRRRRQHAADAAVWHCRTRCVPRCWSVAGSSRRAAATSSMRFTAFKPTPLWRTWWPCWTRSRSSTASRSRVGSPRAAGRRGVCERIRS